MSERGEIIPKLQSSMPCPHCANEIPFAQFHEAERQSWRSFRRALEDVKRVLDEIAKTLKPKE